MTDKAYMSGCLAEAIVICTEKGLPTGTPEDTMKSVDPFMRDAMLDTPLTDEGKRIVEAGKAAVVKAVEEEAARLAAEKPEFDYNGLREKAVMPAIRQIFKLISEKSDVIVFDSTKNYKDVEIEASKVIDDTFNQMTITIMMDILSKENVSINDIDYVFERMMAIIEILKKIIGQQISGHKREILSRMLGARNPNPDNNRYDVDHATYKDLLAGAVKAKEITGNEDKDYFSNTK